MKIGIALSGGAAKCVAQLGALEALFEMGVKPARISAVSGGALVGVLVCAGMTPREAVELAVRTGSFRYFIPSIRSGGFFTMSRIENTYREQLHIRTFEELKIPLTINATDILAGEVVYFSEGNIIKPLIASASYPAIFTPVELEGRSLLDGGIMNNFPIEPILDLCDVSIGISVGRCYPIEKVGSVQRMFMRSLELAINEMDEVKHGLVDVFIDIPGLNEIGMFEIGRAEEMFQAGYDAAMQQRKAIAMAISG